MHASIPARKRFFGHTLDFGGKWDIFSATIFLVAQYFLPIDII